MVAEHEKLADVAMLVGGELIDTGGGICNVRIADPRDDQREYRFGLESEWIGYDLYCDGEYVDSGELLVNCSAGAGVIAAEIREFLERGESYFEG